MRMAAIYARVSSEQQREEHTIVSQTSALIEFARTQALEVPKAWIFEDEGYSGATLERPGLEQVRDLAAEGQIQAVLVYAPDRLSRKYAYQILLIEELARRHLIRPTTTQGHIGDVLPDKIVYDAQTTSGGSGGPLFNNEGKVIGINFAMVREFGGSNFAIPVGYGKSLLKP